MEYILFIHNNTNTNTSPEQWSAFFEIAKKSGVFQGGSEISNQHQIGNKSITRITDCVVGVMYLEEKDKNQIWALLEMHPVYLQGGTLELCEIPKT